MRQTWGERESRRKREREREQEEEREREREQKEESVCEVFQSCGFCTAGLSLTLKMALIFPQGSRFRGCLCPPSHNALPRGNPSAPLSASTLAEREKEREEEGERERKTAGLI